MKGKNAERVSETVFFKHKYLTNPTVTHDDRVVQAAKELYSALNKKNHGMEKATMESLRELSKMYLNIAEKIRQQGLAGGSRPTTFHTTQSNI